VVALVSGRRRRHPPDWLSRQPLPGLLDVNIFIGTEKAAILTQLEQWFGGPYHIPIYPLGGNGSQTRIDELVDVAVRWRDLYERPNYFIYAGDFDAKGFDIERDLSRGDRVFLLRQGTQGRGIIASGTILTDISSDAHWDGSGRSANFVDLVFECVVPVDERLPTEVLERQLQRCLDEDSAVLGSPMLLRTATEALAVADRYAPDSLCRYRRLAVPSRICLVP
jgi:hypothetical protein